MSDSASPSLLREATRDVYFNRLLISGTSLVLYDYFLTLPSEISEMWNSKFTGAKVLFFVTRYSYIVYTLFLFVVDVVPNPSQTFCRVMFYTQFTWSIPPHVGLYAILTLRTYAIYQKSWYILVVLGLTGVAICVVDLTVAASIPELFRHTNGLKIICDIDRSAVRSITLRFQYAGTILALILDILVFGLTFAKTIRHAIEMRKAGLVNGFGYFILRDGTMYFLVKLVIGVLSAIPLIAPIPAQLGNVATVVPVIGNPLTLVLASRLVLNLRQVSSKQETGGRSLRTVDTIRDPVFAANSFLGNIGAQLRIGPDDEDDFEEEACRDSDIELDFVKNDVVAGESEFTEDSRAPFHV